MEIKKYTQIESAEDRITIRLTEQGEVDWVFITGAFCSGSLKEIRHAHRMLHKAFDMIKEQRKKREVTIEPYNSAPSTEAP